MPTFNINSLMREEKRIMCGLDKPIARKGEQQFAVICRQRSGQDAGVISPVARVFEIEKLRDGDQQDCVSAVLILADMVITKCKPSNRIGCDHLLERIKQRITT